MHIYWIAAIALFLLVVFLCWKLTIRSFRKEYGEKHRKVWGQRTFYWQDVIYISTGITCLILVLLKCSNVWTYTG